MAVNVPLTSETDPFPLPFEGEVFILTRDKTELTIKHGAYTAKRIKGRFFVTNLRMVFIVRPADVSKAKCQNFEAPLRGITNEAFHQPIFGCNNLTANVLYYEEQPFLGELSMRIDFVQGGVNTFLPVFNNVLLATRRQMAVDSRMEEHVPPVHLSSDAPQVSEFLPGHSSAFVDPQDPSTLYTTQPAVQDNRRHDVPAWHASAGGLRSRRH